MHTSRCGVRCDLCERKESVGCKGCTEMDAPFWGGTCEVKSCCEGRQLDHCGVCDEFPCEMVATMGISQGFDPEPRLEQLRQWATGRACASKE